MKDIPRNELLDKLAAGWKVRRKGWDDASMLISKDYGSNSRQVGWWELLKDDWEGEPPGPQQTYKGVSIVVAFRHMRGGAAFIRRSAWTKASIFQDTVSLTCSVDDILAHDWEVWG